MLKFEQPVHSNGNMKQLNHAFLRTLVLVRKPAIGALVLSACICANAISIIGDQFQINYLYPDSSTVIGTFTGTVTASGLTWNVNVGLSVTLTDGKFVVDNSTHGWAGAAFNGISLTDLTQSPGFTSFSLVSVTGNPPR
jgi:hypothetical protein